MADPFLGEIRIFGGNFAPRGNAFCNGQVLAISQNTALFSILGVNYGGDGRANFALPNLQGMAPLGQGQGPGLSPYAVGETGGVTSVSLQQNQMPIHNHPADCDSQGGGHSSPIGAIWGATGRGGSPPYTTNAPTAAMSPQGLAPAGGSQPHNNRSPFLTLNFIIALQGIYPARN